MRETKFTKGEVSINMAYRAELWAEAKKKCRLGEEEIRMAKEMGLNPKSLIKNIPSPKQQWKAPVKVWICEMYAERQRKAENKKRIKAVKLADMAENCREEEHEKRDI